MAKKQKRQVTFTSPKAVSSGNQGVSTVRPGSEFNPDYTYIKKDLQSMGIMVVFFVGALVVLTFFLR